MNNEITIHNENLEEVFFALSDGDLNESQRQKLLAEIENNPLWMFEWTQWQKATAVGLEIPNLVSENFWEQIKFPKNETKVIPFYMHKWFRAGTAAILFLAFTWVIISVNNSKNIPRSTAIQLQKENNSKIAETLKPAAEHNANAAKKQNQMLNISQGVKTNLQNAASDIKSVSVENLLEENSITASNIISSAEIKKDIGSVKNAVKKAKRFNITVKEANFNEAENNIVNSKSRAALFMNPSIRKYTTADGEVWVEFSTDAGKIYAKASEEIDK